MFFRFRYLCDAKFVLMGGRGSLKEIPHHLSPTLQGKKMKLYIANCSKQDHQFTYMLMENPRPFMERIRAGGQIVIDRAPNEVDQIIKQHSDYGLMEATKVNKGFGGIAYRMDKPISVEAIEHGIEQRDQEMIDRALEARKISAVASDQKISETAQEMGIKQKSGLEVEIIEEKKNAGDNSPKFNQTIEVVKETMPPRRGRPKKA